MDNLIKILINGHWAGKQKCSHLALVGRRPNSICNENLHGMNIALKKR
jgi:hypothetical protein